MRSALYLNNVPQLNKFLTFAAACYRPSVCPSLTLVIHTKMVEDRIMKFSPYCSPIPLIFVGKFHLEILMGPPRAGAPNKGRVGKSAIFYSFEYQYLKNGSRYGQSYY